MSRQALGTCPNCGVRIPVGALVIEYETSTGTSMFAECLNCRDVVHPK